MVAALKIYERSVFTDFESLLGLLELNLFGLGIFRLVLTCFGP